MPVLIVLEVTRNRAGKLDQTKSSFAAEVDQLLTTTAAKVGHGRLGSDEFDGLKTGRNAAVRARQVADVSLIEPAISLFGEDTWRAFTVKINPLIARAIHPRRQIFDARGIDNVDLLVDLGFGVGKF